MTSGVISVPLRDDLAAGAFVDEFVRSDLAFKQRDKPLVALVGEDSDFVAEILFQPRDLHVLDQLGAFVLLRALAREDLHVDDDAFDARRADQRSIANVAGLLAEDRAQQFFFRRQLRFAFRRDFADEHIARLHVRADADDAGFVEILQERLADIRNVARDFFRTELGIARFDLEFLDVNRSVVVVLDEPFGNQNRVFKVVTAPRHERDEHVAAESQFALIRARTVRQNLPFHHAVALADDRLLIDAGVLVRSLELRQRDRCRRRLHARSGRLRRIRRER